jgi:hypothetical protein
MEGIGGRNHLSTGARFLPSGKIGKMMTHTNPTGRFTIHGDVPSIFLFSGLSCLDVYVPVKMATTAS